MGTLPVEGNTDTVKQTNEIGMAIPLLEAIAIEGKDISADALLTQRKLAHYLVEQRRAHYHLTVKANQPTLHADIAL
ncbi:MAG: ISAs1 family transposase, partial [Burkholderiales bacterium]|nr:ISAs1 family transposase [Burkholderiales bacterium]